MKSDAPVLQPAIAVAPQPLCALCLLPGELKKSHVIPNAFFKAMKDDGKLVRFDFDRDSPVRLLIESWWQYLLCASCEERFSSMETRWVPRLRDTGHCLARGSLAELIPDFDYDSLSTFLLSIRQGSAGKTLKAVCS